MSKRLSARAMATLRGVAIADNEERDAAHGRSLMYLYRQGLIAQVLDEGRFVRWELTLEGLNVLAHDGRLMRSGRREAG